MVTFLKMNLVFFGIWKNIILGRGQDLKITSLEKSTCSQVKLSLSFLRVQNLDSKDSYWKVIIGPLYYYVTIICQFYNVSDVNINCTLGYWFQGKQCCFLENTDITLDFVLGNIKN